jgi:antitoxin component YwqK of YwqJK toxin-antitoxin module
MVKKYNCQQLYFLSVRICLTNSLGKLNEIYKLYYDNGQLFQEVNYINGIQVDNKN